MSTACLTPHIDSVELDLTTPEGRRLGRRRKILGTVAASDIKTARDQFRALGVSHASVLWPDLFGNVATGKGACVLFSLSSAMNKTF